MSRVPDFKRIVKEDFPAQYQDLIEKLAFPINSHMEQVRNALNKNINFDNLAQDLVTLRILTGANSQPLNNVTFKSKLLSKIRGIMVISATNVSSNTTYQQIQPFITFSQNLDIVNIISIGGLSPNTTYDLLLQTIS